MKTDLDVSPRHFWRQIAAAVFFKCRSKIKQILKLWMPKQRNFGPDIWAAMRCIRCLRSVWGDLCVTQMTWKCFDDLNLHPSHIRRCLPNHCMLLTYTMMCQHCFLHRFPAVNIVYIKFLLFITRIVKNVHAHPCKHQLLIFGYFSRHPVLGRFPTKIRGILWETYYPNSNSV